jgi:hypothetical protein
MQTKLTLRLDSELIERAKRHASATGRSVSQLVSDYFSLIERQSNGTEDSPTPEIVSALHGCLAPSTLDEADYDDYRESRYGEPRR